MMPANASIVFRFLMMIATFEMIPTEQLIEDSEGAIGIKTDEFGLTDSFIDYGFDSTDPIRNLQVMFMLMVFLFIYPFFSLVWRIVFCWSEKCKRCIKFLNNKVYFNTYLRIGLETFLELSITSLLRTLKFDVTTDKSSYFHTIFSCFIMFILAVLLGFGLVFL